MALELSSISKAMLSLERALKIANIKEADLEIDPDEIIDYGWHDSAF